MTYQKLTQDVEKLNNGLKSTKRDLARQTKTLDTVITHCDQEIALLEKEPASPRKAHYLEIYQVRRSLAANNQEIARIVLAFDPDTPDGVKAFQAKVPMIENLRRLVRFQALEFTVLNYRPVARGVADLLRAGATGATTGATTGRLQRGPGAAQAPAQAAGPTARGTGPLSAARSGTGRLSAPGQAPAPGAKPAASGQAPARLGTGTGRLDPAAAPGAAPQRTTGPLAARAATTGGTGQLQSRLAALVADPAKRQQLELLVAGYEEVEQAMAALRGDKPATLAVPPESIEAHLNKIAGKIYYLDRIVDQLGPEAAFLAFEQGDEDPQLGQFMASQVMQGSAAAGASKDKTLTSKLRDFFNI